MSPSVRHSERGAMIIMVAVALLGLTLLSAIVMDYGVLWSARAQAQNAADGGALSGAGAMLLFPGDITAAQVAARKMANANAIWGQTPLTPDILVEVPLTCPPGAGGGSDCIRVDVMRGTTDRNGGTHSNVLPTIFANMVGINSQKISATATAQVSAANGTGCLRPWFLIDKYTDTNHNGQYDAGEPIPGYQVPGDLGTTVDFHADISPSGYGEVNLSGNGGKNLEDAIMHCAAGQFHVGQVIDGKPGGTQGPVKHGVDNVFSWDPSASVQLVNGAYEVINSCASSGACTCDGSCPNGSSVSPRVFIVAVCSPSEADCAAGAGGNGSITVTNFLSFFMDGWELNGKNVITATLIGTAGQQYSGGGTPTAAFLHVIRLVR